MEEFSVFLLLIKPNFLIFFFFGCYFLLVLIYHLRIFLPPHLHLLFKFSDGVLFNIPLYFILFNTRHYTFLDRELFVVHGSFQGSLPCIQSLGIIGG